MNSCRVYTPVSLARAMTAALSHQPGSRWLEPSHGRGVFVEELARGGVGPEEIVGIDLDRRSSKADQLCISVRGTDFLSWSRTQTLRFDRIIGNPPFIAIEKLRGPLREEAASTAWSRLKHSGLNGNLWLSFLLASLRLLKPRGHLSFVLPAAWGYADYAAESRRELPILFREFVCHRSKKPLFPTVQDGCYVIQCFGFMELNRITSSHTYERPEDLEKGLRPPVRPSSAAVHVRTNSPSRRTAQAKTLFKVRLGAVTGDSEYFLLSEDRRHELNLPLECLVPVVTRAKHLTSASIESLAWHMIRDSGDRAYLFRPLPEHVNYPSVRAYLRLPWAKGGCNRKAAWVRKRDTWYVVGLPSECHGFMSGASSAGPWIALNAMKGLVATNTLYVIEFESVLRTKDAKAACALSLLTTFGRNQMAAKTRTYAGGLRKLEPSDVTGAILPVKEEVQGAFQVYAQAMDYLLSEHSNLASELADDWFGSI